MSSSECKCGSDCKCRSESHCGRCCGMICSLIGVLILINAFVWPQWLGIDGWMAFGGILLMFAGVFKSVFSGCNCRKDSECCKSETTTETEFSDSAVPVELPKSPIEHKVHKKRK